jgi:hypothetical protein
MKEDHIMNDLKETLTLAKALSIKNRLAGRLSQAQSNVQTYNSVLAGQRDATGQTDVDVRAEFERYQALQGALVAVKSAIQRANVPVLEDILQLGELKARVQLLTNLNTKNGTEPGFNGVEFLYVATLTKPEVQGLTRRLEAEIDRVQDRLNAYNATTQVELPTAVLELAR